MQPRITRIYKKGLTAEDTEDTEGKDLLCRKAL